MRFPLAQAIQSGGGQDDSIVVAGLKFPQARVHVSAQGMNVEIGPQRLQLRLPPQAAGADPGPLGQFFNAVVFARAEHIARIFASCDGGDLKTRRNFRGQVFQTVHREIDALLGQRFLNFLGEHALGADLGEGDIGDPVAGGLDDLNFDVVPALLEQRLDVIGLPESQLRSAGTDAQPGH